MDKLSLFENITESEFLSLVPVFLADDSNYPHLNNKYEFYKNYKPCSFSIFQRIEGIIPLEENERDFSLWLMTLVEDFVNRLESDIFNNFQTTKENLCNIVHCNIMFFLEKKYRDKKIASIIWNQEFPDIVAKVLKFTIGINPDENLNSHYHFNQLGIRFIPLVIEHLMLREKSIEEILKYSIASGLSGLDLKGAVAAASEYAQAGIEMKSFLSKVITNTDVELYSQKLSQIANGPIPLFHFEQLEKELSLSSQIAWLTDDVIESLFDLVFIQKILNTYPALTVYLIPKNGFHANDFCWQHLEEVLPLPIYNDLVIHVSQGRFRWTKSGARMSTINLQKLSSEVCSIIADSNFAIIKGCRIHEMTQGGFPIPTYTAYVVARSFSEIVSGYDAIETPMLFFRTTPKEYSFYGFTLRGKKPLKVNNGRPIYPILSTTKDHFRRKKIVNAKNLADELETIVDQIKMLPISEKIAAISEADQIASRLVSLTRETYNKIADSYSAIRWEEPHELDKRLWLKVINKLKAHIDEKKLVINSDKPYLLDIGAGNGRDLKYAQNVLGLKAISADNSESFVKIVKKLELEGKLERNSIVLGDMCELSMFGNNTFDIVRHNASLLHMPVIAPGFMADKAISECYRVLKPWGILFIFVKEGQGVGVVDTGEGLGGRFYQFFDIDLLRDILERNQFTILEISREEEERGEKKIPWLAAIATKS